MTDAPGAGALSAWLATHDGPDLRTLSFQTGVDHATLTLIDEGVASPDPHHVRALRHALPDAPAALLSGARGPAPLTEIVTRRGTLPAATVLLTVAAADAAVGDLIAYAPPSASPGSHWARIDALTSMRRGATVEIATGGARLEVASDHPLRIARRAAPSEG